MEKEIGKLKNSTVASIRTIKNGVIPGFLSPPIPPLFSLYINDEKVDGTFFDFGDFGIIESNTNIRITEEHILRYLNTGSLF